MFDLDQTFSFNLLIHEQMFDRLATSANKAEKATNQKHSLCGVAA